MSQRKLRDELRDYYISHELPERTVQRLLLLDDDRPRRGWRRGEVHRGSLPRVALAAVAVAALVGLAIFLPGRTGIDTGQPLARAVAGEIAMNHLKALESEYQTTSYTKLRATMDKLDFHLVEPSRLETRGFHLAGARYCSIQGRLAAQLHLAGASGETVTLYQAPMPPGLTDLLPTEIAVDGVRVELWQEDGIFLGAARGASSAP